VACHRVIVDAREATGNGTFAPFISARGVTTVLTARRGAMTGCFALLSMTVPTARRGVMTGCFALLSMTGIEITPA
jgi:hypothetical protein